MVNWISLNTTGGTSGTSQISLTVAANNDYSARTTSLTVTTLSKNLTETVVINQAQKTATGSMAFSPSALTYTYQGGILYLNFTANTDWNVVSWPTWVGISGDGTSGSAGTFTWGVTAASNSSDARNSTFTFYCGGNYFTVPVYQEAYQESSGYTNQYLTFEIISGGTLYWKTDTAETLEYRINKGNWNSVQGSEGSGYDASSSALTGTVITQASAGDIIEFRANFDWHIINNYRQIRTDAKFNTYGNIMSLADKNNFSSLISYDFKGCPEGLYMYNDGLINAENLILPATALAYGCYNSMFRGCTSLTTAPELPATNLNNAPYCYADMFNGCTSLTTAPALPATTLADSCYSWMFAGCTGLTTAPELPATTLVQGCYADMFYGCYSLVSAPELPANTLVYGCYSQMFYDCTGLTTAPELPATTLANNCYYAMFDGCSNLNYIKCLATDISASNCTKFWVFGVLSTGTFVKASGMNDWTRGFSGIPNNWTVQDA